MNQPPRSPKADTPLLEMRSIAKHFGGVMAVAGVSLSLDAGEALGIVGDNGAGKSTLIKVLTGVHEPDEGDIQIEGRPVSITNKRQSRLLGIEAVYQNLGLVDTLDAAGNVFLGHELKRRVLGLTFLDNDRMAEEAARVLKEQVGIELEDIHVPTHHLSGGQRQAVAIARAIYATDLKILVMDEPTAALGPEETRHTLALMQNLKEQGIALIVISHNLDHVFRVADRVMVMRAGRAVATLDCQTSTKQDVLAHIVDAADTEAA
ncbi:MAG: ATP-binding cassette domain-containing protein [Alphaproteobacteria bacterium]|nr:ATP-binding cassette domain-containing protein [Alphaproteobacteria bacterium]